MAVLPVKRGLSSPAVTGIPQDWDRQWFRYFIDNFLSNADIRNVSAGSGITVSGNVSGNSTTATPSTIVTISQSPIASNTVLGNVTGVTAVPVAISPTQLTTLINVFTPSLSGAVPASGGGTTTFLRADGTFTVPSGSSAIPNNTVLGNVSGGSAVAIALTQTQLTTLINTFTSSLSGAVPASGGGTTSFLRADATFVIPPTFTSGAAGYTPASGGGTTAFLRADAAFAVPPTFTSGAAGYVPASGGGTTNFLRADGAFAAPTTSTGANPSASVGLSAINGAATTFLRSDGAPALNQSISPVWSSNHIFTPGAGVAVTINGTVGNGALTVNGAANSGTIFAVAATTASGFGDIVVQRSSSTANAFSQGPNLKLEDTSGSDFSMTFQASGGQTELWSGLGASQNQVLKIASTRAMTINAPTSGATLVVNGVQAQSVIVNGAAGFNPFVSVVATTGQAAGLSVVAGGQTFATNDGFMFQASGGDVTLGVRSSNIVNIQTNSTTRIAVSAAGDTTVVGKCGINNSTPPAKVTGWGTPTSPVVVANFSGTAATTLQIQGAIAKIITDLIAFGLYGA